MSEIEFYRIKRLPPIGVLSAKVDTGFAVRQHDHKESRNRLLLRFVNE